MLTKMIHCIKVSLAGVVLVCLVACSSQDIKPDINHNPSMLTNSAQSIKRQSAPHQTQGRPLWIWIAPRYRADMPEGTGEYLIESI